MTRMLAVRVPPELFRRVRIYAAHAGLTMQALVRAAVAEYLDRHARPIRKQ